jgi:hypothetical protein
MHPYETMMLEPQELAQLIDALVQKFMEVLRSNPIESLGVTSQYFQGGLLLSSIQKTRNRGNP